MGADMRGWSYTAFTLIFSGMSGGPQCLRCVTAVHLVDFLNVLLFCDTS